jgi:acyl-CoA reductase-like NAD-dependent aldehyde dehydrogenase
MSIRIRPKETAEMTPDQTAVLRNVASNLESFWGPLARRPWHGDELQATANDDAAALREVLAAMEQDGAMSPEQRIAILRNVARNVESFWGALARRPGHCDKLPSVAADEAAALRKVADAIAA